MFDLPTILTLIAPAALAPVACALLLRAIGRAEASRPDAAPAPVPAPAIVFDPAPAVAPERERSVA